MRKKTLFFIVSMLMQAFLLMACLCGSLDEVETDAPEPTATEAAPTATVAVPTATKAVAGPTTRTTVTSAPAGQAGAWLVMLYQNADDEVLEKDIFTDLNEAELVGSTSQVTIVAQLDRYKGAFRGDGNWTSTKRFLVTQDDDLTQIASEELEDLGEVDSGDPQTLVDFAVWAMQAYPADRYALILSDHGAGWMGGWNDDDPEEGSSFSVNEIDQAMAEIVAQAGQPLELIGFDACLMSQVEAISAMVPYARYAVASEEVEPSLGWAYAAFLDELIKDPDMDGAKLAQVIVDSYVIQDGRITNDRARKVFAEENDLDETMSAQEMAEVMSVDITLTALDLSAVKELNAALNDLAEALAAADTNAIAEARAYAQAYESVFGEDMPPSYIDLGHFMSILAENLDDNDVTKAIKAVRQSLGQTVIAEKHGPDRPGSSGLTLFFPDSDVYQLTTDPDAEANYTSYASRFAVASLWDDFLLTFYTGEAFDPAAADLSVLDPITTAGKPPAAKTRSRETTVKAPGAAQITIAPLVASATEVKPDGAVTLSTEITSQNGRLAVGYIYLYTLYYDEESSSYLVADITYIGADKTKEIDGVFYPDWESESQIDLEVDWEPIVYYMSDGNEANEQFACFEPDTYGVKEEDDVYTVRGIYTFAESGDQRGAVIEFDGAGKMKDVLVFMKQDGTGAPRKVAPNEGDRFTILEQWLEYDQNPDGEFVDYEGGAMTFGSRPFEWVAYDGYVGPYVVGIVVEDLDGNEYAEFVEITVKE